MNIRCYDNGGKTADRYTVIYMDCLTGTCEKGQEEYDAIGMNEYPFHPQGIGQHCTAMPGNHLGKRIPFEQLPADCQKVVKQDLAEISI